MKWLALRIVDHPAPARWITTGVNIAAALVAKNAYGWGAAGLVVLAMVGGGLLAISGFAAAAREGLL